MIAVEQLAYRYDGHDREVLAGIDLRVERGELLLASGATGSAKTTLSLILCGAIPHLLGGRLQGRVLVAGGDVARQPVRATARRVGLVMQNVQCQLVTDRVDDELAFGLENFALPPDEIERKIPAALAEVRAVQLRCRFLDGLSAGERQRVALAAVLCLDQPVLLLDEPLAYLDRGGCAELAALLRGLADRGRAIVVFEHRRDLLETVADRSVWLDQGRLASEPPVVPPLPPLSRSLAPGPVRLSFENVALLAGGRPLLERVGFTVRGGESVVLLGDNGAGKTTLMRAAMHLVRTARGTIRVGDRRVAETPTRRLAAEAALVLQHPDQQLSLASVGEELRAAAGDEAAARQELEAFRLHDLLDRHPQSLSMGQKRRLTLAAALARRPRLLLLDEPTVGQDDDSLACVIQRLDRFVADGGALLAATHDVRAARALAHRVVRLDQGRVHEQPPEGVAAFFGGEQPFAELSR